MSINQQQDKYGDYFFLTKKGDYNLIGYHQITVDGIYCERFRSASHDYTYTVTVVGGLMMQLKEDGSPRPSEDIYVEDFEPLCETCWLENEYILQWRTCCGDDNHKPFPRGETL